MSHEFSAPRSVDINPTALCNLSCDFCWGPDHNIQDGLSTQQVIGILEFFSLNGTQNVVFTGGEPLIRQDIGELVKAAHDFGLRTTLSTNAILLPKKAEEVLPYVDEIGIPLDGSTPGKNNLMRLGNPRSFQASLNGLGLVASYHSHVQTTVRTVVSAVNKDDIVKIGSLLEQNKDKFHRWKLYQFSEEGAEGGAWKGIHDRHRITEADFLEVATDVRRRIQLPEIVEYPAFRRVGRYVFVGPQGDVYGVGSDGMYKGIGNFYADPSADIKQKMSTIFSSQSNMEHAAEYAK